MQRFRDKLMQNPKAKLVYRKAYLMKKTIQRVITDNAYMDWSYLVLSDKKVAYMVMQKVACTSIKASMIGMQSDQDYLALNVSIRKTGHVVSSLDPKKYEGYFVFTFVRNPFERLISCYENKYHTDKAIRGSRPKDIGMEYDAYLWGYLSKDRGFRSFARRVCHIPDRISDQHFASQVFMIDRMGKNPKPDFVGHYEHLAEEYEPIRARFDFMPLPHHNKTPKAMMWMDYYDLDTAKKVYRRYQKDFERFGYQDTYEQLIAYLEKKERTLSASAK